MQNESNLIWIDLEMTGLNPKDDHIIELATIVTDQHLNILEEGPVFAIHQPQSMLDKMDEWNTRTHSQSGLVKRIQESQITEAVAEEATLNFLKKYLGPNQSPMCGNSIYQDRRFLTKYMPRLEAFFHYRNLDVSTLKELAKRWRPDVYAGLQKESKHQALDDIKDSIEELAYYRMHFIKMSG